MGELRIVAGRREGAWADLGRGARYPEHVSAGRGEAGQDSQCLEGRRSSRKPAVQMHIATHGRTNSKLVKRCPVLSGNDRVSISMIGEQ